MNLDWTSLVIGLIIGWLLEWIIDWLYWRKGSDSAELEDLRAQLELAQSNSTDLETALSVARGEATHWEDKYIELEAECAGVGTLRAEIDELNARINADRLRYIEQLTTLPGVDEERALMLIDAGYRSPYDLVDADPEGVRLALGQDQGDFDAWWGALALAGLGIAATADHDDEVAELTDDTRMGLAFGADADVDLDEEGLAAELIVAEELDLIDLDGDGEVDAVIDTVVTGVDVDHDGEMDEILSESVDAIVFEDEDPATRGATIDLSSDADDLTLVQGIGPAYGRRLNAAGIFSFAALSALDDDELDAIVQRQSFQQIDYDNWRTQARTFAMAGLPGVQGDNLQRLEGIGPEYDRRLRAGGITTYAQLAAATPEALAEVIKAPAWRNVNYAAWIAQAELAAAGDDAGLQTLQDELFSRSSDNLLLIHGVGENYNKALLAAGITTYSDLATRSPETLAAIMADAGLRSANYEAWIEEAGLRAAGKRVPRATRSYADAVVVTCPQDLDQIDGIGTVYEQRLYAAGIGSYWEVSQLTDEQLEDILQAEAFQDVDTAEIRASATRLAVESNTVNRVWDGTEPDDFEVFDGIGVIYERRLYNAGYCTYEALAQATIEALIAACKPPKGQSPDFAGWVATAQILAAAKGASDE